LRYHLEWRLVTLEGPNSALFQTPKNHISCLSILAPQFFSKHPIPNLSKYSISALKNPQTPCFRSPKTLVQTSKNFVSNPRKPYFKQPKTCILNPKRNHISNQRKPYFKPQKPKSRW
jgi:hypothetical protein